MSTLSVLQEIFLLDDGDFIDKLYREFLGDAPDIGTKNYYIQCFSNGLSKFDALNSLVRSKTFEQKLTEPVTLSLIIRSIMSKSEYKFVEECYYQILSIYLSFSDIQRKAAEFHNSQSKFKFIRNILMTPDVIKYSEDAAKTGEQNYQNRLWSICHDTSADFLSKIFNELLDRSPYPDERNFLSSYSTVDIYRYLVMSSEFESLVNQKYTDHHLEHLKELLKLKDDSFIMEIYRDCLGREVDVDGYQTFWNLLKAGTPKLTILRAVMLSVEASKKIEESLDDDSGKALNVWGNLWPGIKSSIELRSYVQSNIVEHKLPFTTNILVKTGGIGDFIQMTAVAKALKKKEPNHPIVAIIPHSADLFEGHPYIDLVLECGPLGQPETVKSVIGLADNVYDLRYVSRAYGSWKLTKFFKDNEWYYSSFPHSDIRIDDLGKHVCDLALISLGLDSYATSNDTLIVPDENINKISGNYVIVCNSIGSGPGRMKCWTQEGWNSLIKWLTERGLLPVQLGRSTDSLLSPLVLDLRGKTTLRQSAGYMKYSKAYIGVEGGLFHMAKAVKAPAVVIFATTPSVCFAYSDTIVLSKNVCRPCWWTEPWNQSKCMRSCKVCMNLPDWETVAGEISKLLKLQ